MDLLLSSKNSFLFLLSKSSFSVLKEGFHFHFFDFSKLKFEISNYFKKESFYQLFNAYFNLKYVDLAVESLELVNVRLIDNI